MSRPVLKARALLAAALLAGSLAALSPPAAAEDSPPDLRGSWSGEGTGGAIFGQLGHQPAAPEPRFLDRSITWTLTIEQQQGSGLIGRMSSPQASEVLLGVIRSDNKTVLFVDEDSHLTGILRADGEMELCLQETGDGSMVATCRILRRQ